MTPAGGRAARAAAAAFAVLVVLHLAAVAAHLDPVRAATKPLLMPALAAYAVARRAPRPLVAALACGWGGDVLLEIGGTVPFLLGMACFAAGHVCYLRLFAARGAFAAGPGRARSAVRIRCAVYGAVWAVLVALLWPGLDSGLRVPVAVYSLLLAAMAAGAYGLGAAGALGGVLFLLSDGMIAVGLADWPRPPAHDLWVMLTYAAAQGLLTLAVLGAAPVEGGPVEGGPAAGAGAGAGAAGAGAAVVPRG